LEEVQEIAKDAALGVLGVSFNMHPNEYGGAFRSFRDPDSALRFLISLLNVTERQSDKRVTSLNC
jgi:hypothetical protein